MSGYVNTANLQPLRVLTHTLTSYNKVMVTDAIANRAYFHLKAKLVVKYPSLSFYELRFSLRE